MAIFGNFFFVGGNNGSMTVAGSFSNAVNSPDVWQPPTDVFEMENGWLVLMDLPGVDADTLEVTVESQLLIVRGVRQSVCGKKVNRYVQMEIPRGIFGKIITLSTPIAEANCSAVLKNGVLEIFLPYGKRVNYVPTAIRIESER